MTLNPKHKCHSYFNVSYSQLLLNKMTMFTSPLLHTFMSPTHQQKTFKGTVTLRISYQIPLHRILYLTKKQESYHVY